MTEAEDDSNLFELKNDFILGNYQSVINNADNVSPSSDRQKTLIKFYVYRAMVAQGDYMTVTGEVTDKSEPELRAVKLLADYLADVDQQASAVTKVKALMKDGEAAGRDGVRLVCASIYLNHNDYENALRCVRGSSDLECLALSVQTYLSMNRPDLAEKDLKAMQTLDDDHSCTQLAAAWLSIAAGGEKHQEAHGILHELCEKFTATAPVLNAMAVCNIHMGKFELAESELMDAIQKNNKNGDTIANMIVVAMHRGKSDEILKRYFKQLEQVAPRHAWLLAYKAAGTSFDNNKDRFQKA